MPSVATQSIESTKSFSQTQQHYINVINLVKKRFSIDTHVKGEDDCQPQHTSSSYNYNWSSYCLYLYKEDSRIMIRISQFDAEKFLENYQTDLREIGAKIKVYSNEFFNNSIDRWQLNLQKSKASKKINEIIDKRYKGEVVVDCDDHVHGGPVHLVMDITKLTDSKGKALLDILRVTQLSRKLIIC